MPQLTAKELSAIEDQLNCEQLLVKKYKNYAQMTQDAQIRNTCEQFAAKHKSHYDILMGHLSS
ncbi:MAG: spore coat protein [Oscillospiraceae bacterium]|jgi:rubrerythrin|nr:spore coat protein [Oscillospiraceae bacterium]